MGERYERQHERYEWHNKSMPNPYECMQYAEYRRHLKLTSQHQRGKERSSGSPPVPFPPAACSSRRRCTGLPRQQHVQLLGFKRLLTINICLFILFVLPHAHTIYPHTCLYCELQALNAHTVYPPTCSYCSPLVCKSLSPRTSASGSCPMGSAAATTLPVRPLGDDIVSGFADS